MLARIQDWEPGWLELDGREDCVPARAGVVAHAREPDVLSSALADADVGWMNAVSRAQSAPPRDTPPFVGLGQPTREIFRTLQMKTLLPRFSPSPGSAPLPASIGFAQHEHPPPDPHTTHAAQEALSKPAPSLSHLLFLVTIPASINSSPGLLSPCPPSPRRNCTNTSSSASRVSSASLAGVAASA